MVDELVFEGLTLRLKDADVEVTGGQSSEFIPLEKIGGRVLGTSKDSVRVQIGWLVTVPVVAQYGWSFAPFANSRVFTLSADQVLQVRAFFERLAARTGREVEQEPPPKKGWFRR